MWYFPIYFLFHSHSNTTSTNYRWGNLGLDWCRYGELPKVIELANSEARLFSRLSTSGSFIFISMPFFSQADLSQESYMILLRQGIHKCTHCTRTGQHRRICPPTCTNFPKEILSHLKKLSRLQGYDCCGTKPPGKVFDKTQCWWFSSYRTQGLLGCAHQPAHRVTEIEFAGAVRMIWHAFIFSSFYF